MQLTELRSQLQRAEADLQRRTRELRCFVQRAQDVDESERADYLVGSLRSAQEMPEAPASMPMHAFDRCVVCNSNFTVLSIERSLLCPGCGTRIEAVDTSGQTTSMPYCSLDRKTTVLTEQRADRVRDAIKHLCSKSRNVCPPNIVIEVASYLYSQDCLRSVQEITYLHVRNALKALGLGRLLNYTMQIYASITGRLPPRLTARAEENFRVLFSAIQDPFERLKPRPSSAFLSMPYVMLTLSKFLGYHELLGFFPLVKTRMPMHEQQELMRSIFEDLGWNPFPELTTAELNTVA